MTVASVCGVNPAIVVHADVVHAPVCLDEVIAGHVDVIVVNID